MTTHSARMDAIYRGQRHIYDITRKYYLLGRDRVIDDLAPPPGGSVLEVGCGTGRNLIVAARRWPDARFFGIDISEAMLATARAKVARAGLASRITLEKADAAAFDPKSLFGLTGFDRIMLSYTLSMIPDWRGALCEAARHLAPEGRLAMVDFGQQEQLPRWWRSLLFAWLARFAVTPRGEMSAALALCEGCDVSLESVFRGYAWRATLARYASSNVR